MKSFISNSNLNKRFIPLIFVFTIFTGIIFIDSTIAQEGINLNNISQFCSQQKGFNLLGKFDVSWSNTGFIEKEIPFR